MLNVDKIADINRATRGGFLRYMFHNPHYYQYVFGKSATRENITDSWRQIKTNGLAAAANLPRNCIKCEKAADKCCNCIHFQGRPME
jgi:hypothetical protein